MAGENTSELRGNPPARTIGQSDLAASPLALGAATFGWTLPSGLSTHILDRYVELGGNLIDTADSYSSGMSEQIIGRWHTQRGNRGKVIIATKVGRNPDYTGLTRSNIITAVDASLERLQTDYIDLLYFHAEDPNVSIEESLAAAQTLIEAGKVRYLGASNFTASSLLEARILTAGGLPRFEAVALEYSLLHRDIVEGNVAMMAQTQNLSIMPYFILAHGYLGRMRGIKNFSPEDIRARRASQQASRHGAHVVKTLEDIAMSHGVDISTVATAWVLSRPAVGSPAIGVDSLADLDALMHATELELHRHELAELEKVSADTHRSWVPGRKSS